MITCVVDYTIDANFSPERMPAELVDLRSALARLVATPA